MKKSQTEKKTTKPETKKTLTRSQTQKRTATLPVVVSNRRREWRFELPLKAVVEGRLPDGGPFRETTTLENISSGGAYFCLNSGVVVGSKLSLMINLPEKLTEGRKMRLVVGGTAVRLEKPDRKGKKQGVAVRFRRDFKFVAVDEAESEEKS